MKFAIIDFGSAGRIDWENETTICVRGSKYYKPRTHIQRIGFVRYYLIKILRTALEKLEGEWTSLKKHGIRDITTDGTAYSTEDSILTTSQQQRDM